MKWISKLFRLFQDIDFMAMVVLSILFALFCFHEAHARDVRTVKLDQSTVARIYVSPGRSTVLSFPSKPGKVILGNQGVFAVEYVENDLAIAALSGRSHSDLFVYLEGRRFAFDLQAVPADQGREDTIVLVRDAIENPKGDAKPQNVSKLGKPHFVKRKEKVQ
jgi:hypothetical protein